MCPKRTTTTPSPDRVHADLIACRAAVAARKSGAGIDECARVHAATYADAMAS